MRRKHRGKNKREIKSANKNKNKPIADSKYALSVQSINAPNFSIKVTSDKNIRLRIFAGPSDAVRDSRDIKECDYD